MVRAGTTVRLQQRATSPSRVAPTLVVTPSHRQRVPQGQMMNGGSAPHTGQSPYHAKTVVAATHIQAATRRRQAQRRARALRAGSNSMRIVAGTEGAVMQCHAGSVNEVPKRASSLNMASAGAAIRLQQRAISPSRVAPTLIHQLKEGQHDLLRTYKRPMQVTDGANRLSAPQNAPPRAAFHAGGDGNAVAVVHHLQHQRQRSLVRSVSTESARTTTQWDDIYQGDQSMVLHKLILSAEPIRPGTAGGGGLRLHISALWGRDEVEAIKALTGLVRRWRARTRAEGTPSSEGKRHAHTRHREPPGVSPMHKQRVMCARVHAFASPLAVAQPRTGPQELEAPWRLHGGDTFVHREQS